MLYLRYGIWKLKNRHKYLLQYHIIWGRKYSKKLLASKQISDDIKQFSYEICQNGKKYPNYLRKHFWKEYTFGTNGHFAFNAGNVSEEMLKSISKIKAEKEGDSKC